jgi:L,D-transpeptidase YcbB
MSPYRFFALVAGCLAMFIIFSCNNGKNDSSTIADTPGEMQTKSVKILQQYIDAALADDNFQLDSAVTIKQAAIAKGLYEENDFEPLWCKKQEWLPEGDSLFTFIVNAKLFGLLPEAYHLSHIDTIRKQFAADSMSKGSRKEVALWSKADIMLTDAFIQMASDIKIGRLPADSISQRKDSILTTEFCKELYKRIKNGGSVASVFESLEPIHAGYIALKKAIPYFFETYDEKVYTFVPTKTDSLKFIKALQHRLFEGGFILFTDRLPDSLTLAAAIAKFQKQKGIAADGKAGDGTVRALNGSDKEKFLRIAISMDRYKLLPEKMPQRYIWVNAAANSMDVVENGKTEFSSKVICGKPNTRTPVLTSIIKEVITYPQWVPPPSIVMKEILPALKRNPGYLARRGFSLETWGGKKLDPYSINWAKYSKSVPYKIVQGSSDGNALGVMKFVFDNKYSVYLHDTNQRYLFNSSNRSLSHGCVRVQEWDRLAKYILTMDSLNTAGTKYTSTDSLTSWLTAKKKKSIPVRTPLPVYIRYITCEGRKGSIVFYEDVYAEDRWLREKYFAAK